MKPLQKVVTAADVQSCLYYVHVDSAHDDGNGEAIWVQPSEVNHTGGSDGSEGSSWSLGESELRRKPVPINGEENMNNRPDHRAGHRAHFQTLDHRREFTQIGRKTISQDVDIISKTPVPYPKPSIPHPFGPRSMEQRHLSVDKTGLAEQTDLKLRKISELLPTLPTRPPPSPEHGMEGSSSIHGPRSFDKIPELSAHNSATSFSQQGSLNPRPNPQVNEMKNKADSIGRQSISLTLIRRYDGLQWNVGKIFRTDEAMEVPEATRPDDASGFNEAPRGLYVDILTPGYEKFTTKGAPSNGNPQLHEMKGGHALFSQNVKTGHVNAMASSKKHDGISFKAEIKNAKIEKSTKRRRNSGSNSSLLDKRGPRSSMDFQRNSNEKMTPDISGKGQSHTPPASRPPEHKSYTFQSPWNGTCEFTSSLTNRSLRCKHTIAPSHAHSAHMQSNPVSELRFNLPGTKPSYSGRSPTLTSWAPDRPPSSSSSHSASKRSSFLRHHLLPSKHHHHHHHRSSSEEHKHRQREGRNQSYDAGSNRSNATGDNDNDNESGNDEERMDLSLGQERAGGGMGGKEAKLGKLIVEPEGLQMLDLVVAANVGVWWGVYEQRV
jgi:hypothetical protein